MPKPSRPSEADPEAAQKALCTLIETAATENGLPVGFFTRLIWKESRFRSEAVSPKGAQGIAQFMPGTAAERGLEDPFDAATAIPASARFLAELKDRFGNLGLAAAAYNAGPERVSNWLADDATLPFETQNYVLSITGVAADDLGRSGGQADASRRTGQRQGLSCARGASEGSRRRAHARDRDGASAPWGVQVAGGFSRALVIGAYSSLQGRFPSLLADRAADDHRRAHARTRPARLLPHPRSRRDAAPRARNSAPSSRQAGGSCVVLKT